MQTKENLTLRATAFGSKCELPVPYLDKMCKGGLTDNIVRFAEFKNQKELKKGDGGKRSRLIGEHFSCRARRRNQVPTYLCTRVYACANPTRAWRCCHAFTGSASGVRVHQFTTASVDVPVCFLAGISKLDDANDAGSTRSRNCTLILTEGDSAKALAISGLGVIGRDNYGVFPLRCGGGEVDWCMGAQHVRRCRPGGHTSSTRQQHTQVLHVPIPPNIY